MSDNSEALWSTGTALFQTSTGQRAAAGCASWGIGGEHRIWIAVFDTQTGRELYRLTDHQANIWRMVVSVNGEKALSGAMGGELMLWNLNTGKLIRKFDIAAAINGIDLSSDGTRALTSVTGDIDLEEGLVLWDVDSGTVIDRYPFEVPLADVVFGPNETSAIATNGDARIIKIDLATREIEW